MIRAVFFDMDGTLLSFKTHSAPPDTREALHTLREQGIKVFLATGRHMTRWVGRTFVQWVVIQAFDKHTANVLPP